MASACMTLDGCFQDADAKGCHGPVNNSLTKLSRLRFDPTILDRVPFLSDGNRAAWRFDSIGSVTNQSYRLTTDQHSYFLRIAGETTRYLDRGVETHNTAIAADLGLTPPILYLDDTILVTAFVEGRPLTAADLEDAGRLQQVASLIRRVQRSDRPFRHERHPFGEIDRYLGQYPHPRAVSLRQAARPIAAALSSAPRALVPAHVDAGVDNFLLGADGRLWLVDWEFSSMADPAWDPASVLMLRSEESEEDEAVRRFVATILGDAGVAAMARIGLFRAALTLVAGSWCAMEAVARDDNALMGAAERYLDRCEAILAGARLARWLRDVTEA